MVRPQVLKQREDTSETERGKGASEHEQEQWHTVRNTRPRVPAGDNQSATRPQAQAVVKTKQSSRKVSPTKKAAKVAGNDGSKRSPRLKLSGTDTGDGRIVFAQLRRYLTNEAPKEYVYHMVLRLNALAKERRFQKYKNSLTSSNKEAKSDQILKTGMEGRSPTGTTGTLSRAAGLLGLKEQQSCRTHARTYAVMGDTRAAKAGGN